MKLSRTILVIFVFIYQILPAQNSEIYQSHQHFYNEALNLLEIDQYNAARNKFNTYIKKAENGTNVINAKFYSAFCKLKAGAPNGATEIENFAKKYPDHKKSIYAYYQLANHYYDQKNYSKSISYYEKIKFDQIERQKRFESRFKLGYAQLSEKKFQDALSNFNKIKYKNHQYTSAARYYAGYLAYRQKEYKDALKDLKIAGENKSYKNKVPHIIAIIHYKRGHYQKLIKYGENVINQINNLKHKGEIYKLLAEAYFKKNNYKKATSYFKKYDNSGNSFNHKLNYRYGFALFQQEEYLEAIKYLKKVARKNDTLGHFAAYNLGNAYLKIENKPFAQNAFNQARKMDFVKEIKPKAALKFAKVSFEMENFSEVIDVCKNFIENYPDHKNINQINDLLGDAYLRTNDYQQAIEHIENLKQRSTRINKAYQNVTYYRGVELFNQENFLKAIDMFNKSLNYTYDDQLAMFANYWCGEAFSIGNNYEKAINYYKKVFKYSDVNDPDNYRIKTNYGLGYAYYNQKKYENALTYFKKFYNKSFVINDEKYKNDVILRLADCYYATKKYKDAIIYYNKALDAKKSDQDYAHFQKGVVLGITDKVEKAKKELKKVINNYPQSQYADDALFNIGVLSMRKSNYEEAIISFSDLLKNHEKSSYVPYALQKRALANFNLKRYDASVSDYKKILRNYSDHKVSESSLMGLQEALANAERSEEFDTLLARYKKTNPDDENVEYLQFESAKTQYFNLKYKKAINKFESFIKEYPESNYIEEARYYLAQAYLKTGNHEKALTHYNFVFNKGKKSAFVRKAAQKTASIYKEKENFRKAINYYQKLTKIAANKKELFNAWSGMVIAYHTIGKYDSSTHYANMLLQTGTSDVRNANLATLYLGKNSYEKGNYKKAKDHFINTINQAKDQYGAEAQYLLAKIQYKQKNYDSSLETLFDLNKKFNNYKKWVGKSFLLIADNYIAKDEIFQAKATLKSLIDNFPEESIRNKASEKLKKLEKKQNNQKSVDTVNAD